MHYNGPLTMYLLIPRIFLQCTQKTENVNKITERAAMKIKSEVDTDMVCRRKYQTE